MMPEQNKTLRIETRRPSRNASLFPDPRLQSGQVRKKKSLSPAKAASFLLQRCSDPINLSGPTFSSNAMLPQVDAAQPRWWEDNSHHQGRTIMSSSPAAHSPLLPPPRVLWRGKGKRKKRKKLYGPHDDILGSSSKREPLHLGRWNDGIRCE